MFGAPRVFTALLWVTGTIGLGLLLPALAGAGEFGLSLAGKWRFALDRADAGIAERWFENKLSGTIKLPGSLPAQGIGDEVTVDTKWTGGIVDRSFFTGPEFAPYRQPGHVKVPFWLQPDKYYAGPAWFQREIEVSPAWQGRRIVLFLERPHWETRVWVDGHCIGTNNSLSTPHEYDLGQLVPGKHTLTVRVDNGMVIEIGENSHCVTDHTQGNWNGIVGKIELRARPLVWIEEAQVFPSVTNKSVHVVIQIGNVTDKPGHGSLAFVKGAFSPSDPIRTLGVPVNWQTNGGTGEMIFALGKDAELWDEFHPALQKFTAILFNDQTDSEQVPIDSREITFGLREISTDGTQFVINGRKAFIRGTLECCVFPKTGHPPMEVEEWRRIIRIAKAYGLNLLRFHSYCPSEAAFLAADELGMYFQIETCWANQSTTLGDGKPVDQWVWNETEQILKAYGNHPSFLLMPYGNEPGGRDSYTQNAGPHVIVTAYLAKYVEHFKAVDPRRLWTSGSGWPQLPQNQFHVTPDPRIQAWGGGLKSRINARPPETLTDYRDYVVQRSVPVISHEIGQWCVYPNFAEIPKYTGYLKPKNFEIFRAFLDQNGMGGLAKQFLLASGKLQTLCYKEEIESALRTRDMGGFELLDLHDFPGQGTALVGVLDPFWDDKGYVTAAEYSRFCNSTVPLARMTKRVFTADEHFKADLEVANFGPAPMSNAVMAWKLVSVRGKIFAQGALPARTIPVDNCITLGGVDAALNKFAAPAKYKLVVGIAGTKFENDWDIWIYPTNVNPDAPANVAIMHDLDKAAMAKLDSGGKVLLLIPPARVRNATKEPVKFGFSSIFWNTAWTGRQAPTTLGILCDPKHPAFADFPTDFCSNWQWWYLVHSAGVMILDDFPANLRSTVQVIDDWVTARKLGLLFEARLGKGKLLVCSIDIEQDIQRDPVRRQFRRSLFNYLAGEKFNPQVPVTAHQVRDLFAPARNWPEVRSIKADSEEEGYEATNALDGDQDTLWHTRWTNNAAPHPHALTIELKEPMALRGVAVLPRQDDNRNGWIKDYECYVSADGMSWGAPAAKGTFNADANLKTVSFERPVTGRFVRFIALTGFDDDPFTSMAEFSLVQEGTSQ